MSSDDHVAGTNWMAPGAAEPQQLDHLPRRIRSVLAPKPVEKISAGIPMQVTLDPVYCTLAIEAGRHRQTFRRRGRTASDVQIRMK